MKLKDREEKKEDKIQRVMCEGICDRCREKLQWKFKYDKYKPLTKPGTCQHCKEKRIAKAYRSFCDPCASAKRACAGCCGDLAKLNRERRAEIEAKNASKVSAEDEEEGGSGDEKGGDSDMEGGSEDGVFEEEEGTAAGGGASQFGIKTSGTMKTDQAYLEAELSTPTSVFVTDRDMRKIEDFGASKYSKARVVGSEEDKNLAQDLKLHTQSNKR